MKILIDLTSLADNFSGIERFAMCIAKELIHCRDNKYVIIFKNEIHSEFKNLVDNDYVKVYVLKGKNKLLFNQCILPLKIYGIKADIYLFLAFPVPIILFKKNIISGIHDICCWDCPDTMNNLSKWYFRISHRIAMKKCKAIVTISQFSKNRIIDKLHYDKDKLWLIYCGISGTFLDYEKKEKCIIEVTNKYSLPEHYILSLSTLEPRKNLRLLIEAYRELVLNDNLKTDLVLAGRKGWKIDDLLNGIEDEVKDKIKFTGFINEDDLPYIYNNADMFVFPSLYEGFGIPPVEAMSVGTRVISSDSSSLPEVLGDSAIFFKSKDKADLKAKIVYMMEQSASEKQKQIKMGIENSRRFNWSVSAQRFLELLKSIAP